MRICATLLLLFFVALSGVSAMTQPDISAIGDFRAYSGNWKNLDGSKTAKNGNLNMSFDELELAVSGYLNPYAKGWVTVSSPGDGFEIEEAYVTIFKGLPLRSELRGGKFLVDFGKLNSSHVHAFPFIDRPLVHRVFLGGDGFKDEGINWNLLLPTHFYGKLSLSVLKGDIFTGEEPPEDPIEGRYSEQPILNGRLNFFLPIGEKGNLDIGFSGLHGRYKGMNAYGTGDETNGFRNLYAKMAAVDLKYKVKWDDYRSLTLQGELISNHRNIFSDRFETVSNYGGFAMIDYRFAKRYNLGFLFDRAPGIYDNTEDDYEMNVPEDLINTDNAAYDEKNSTTALTFFTGYSLLEETTLIRLAGRHVSYDIADPSLLMDPEMRSKESEFTIVLQLIWSLGPHKPHEF
jgi:hypothetical protein